LADGPWYPGPWGWWGGGIIVTDFAFAHHDRFFDHDGRFRHDDGRFDAGNGVRDGFQPGRSVGPDHGFQGFSPSGGMRGGGGAPGFVRPSPAPMQRSAPMGGRGFSGGGRMGGGRSGGGHR
jgi:hypothetical protein